MNTPRKQPTLEERLRRIMLEGGFRSIRGLAEGCGLAPATLAKRIQKERDTGSAKVDGHTIQRISKKTGFNAHWIMTGEGSPYTSSETAPEPAATAHANPRDRIEWGREVVEGLVLQGISPTRARQAVGALLLQGDTDYGSVLELYQASLEKLGYTHTPVRKEASGKKEPSGKRESSTEGKSRARTRQKRKPLGKS